MPRLVQLFLVSTGIGYALAGVFLALVIWFDVAHLGHLILNVDGGWFAGGVFVVLTGNVFAAVQVGISVMRGVDAAEPPEGPTGPGMRGHATIPVKVDERS
ncbi:MAG: hypothetical protein AAFX45_11255 [Pseudomonadota bacterium]